MSSLVLAALLSLLATTPATDTPPAVPEAADPVAETEVEVAEVVESCPACTIVASDSVAATEDEVAARRVPPTPVSGHRQVLLEIYTGAWCGNCPDGDSYLEQLSAARGGHFVVVSHHYGYGASTLDQMEIEDPDGQDVETLQEDFGLFGWPAGMFDRTHVWTQRQSWKSVLDQRRYAETPLELSFDSTYDGATRSVTVTVRATFLANSSGDTRLNCILTEDPVTGSGSGWDQVNNYDDQVGHLYYQAGDPIPNYQHPHVARAYMDGLYGSPGVVSDPAIAGQSYETVLQHTLEPAIDPSRVQVVCYAASEGTSAGEREVYDAAWARLGESSPDPPLIWDYLETGGFGRWSQVVD